MHVAQRQIKGNDAAREKHGEHDDQHQGLFKHDSSSGEEVSAQGRHDQIQYDTHNQDEHGVRVAGEDIGVGEHSRIGVNAEAQGQKQRTGVRDQLVAVAERAHDHMPYGVQTQQHHQRQKYVVEYSEYSFSC